jgi:hypothetical protein
VEVRTPRTLADVGIVLDTGEGDFEIIVASTVAPDFIVCYGVLNKATGIIEALTHSFAKAKTVVHESHLDAAEGYDRAPAGGFPSLRDIFAAGPDDGPLPGDAPITSKFKKKLN